MWYICTHHGGVDLSDGSDRDRSGRHRLPPLHGRLHQARPFDPGDRHLYRLALADCPCAQGARGQPRLCGLGGSRDGGRGCDRNGDARRVRERAQAGEHRPGHRRRGRAEPLGRQLAMAQQATLGRREQILDATLRVIGRSGREAVTHRAVAEEAGVPLGSTTYYFDSRGDLLRQALEHVAAHEVERYGQLGEALRAVKTPRELADRLISELVAAAEDRIAYIAEYELW